MSELLHNMSAPPRSEVKFKKEQLKRYIAFSPIKLLTMLNTNKDNQKEISKKIEDYYKANIKTKEFISKPSGYMIAEVIEFNSDEKLIKQIKDKLNKYDYIECDNLELLIIVLCSTVGDLYIPHRIPSFENDKFNKILLFPEEEVNS